MTLAIKINAVDVTTNYEGRGLSIRKGLETIPTARFVLTSDAAVGVEFGQEVIIEQDAVRIFCGSVRTKRTLFPSQGSATRRIVVDAIGHAQLAARKIHSFSFPKQLAGDMVKQLIADKLAVEGVTDTGVDDGLEIGPVRVQSAPLSRILDNIADLVGFTWWIDESRVFQFKDRGSVAAPFDITAASLGKTISVERTRTRGEYRNVQYVLAGKDTGIERTRRFQGDSETTTWDVETVLSEAPTVLVGTVVQTLGIRGVDSEDDPSDPQWFWRSGEAAISQNTSATPLTSAEFLEVRFKPTLPVVRVHQDPVEVAARAAIEGGSGRYEDAVLNADLRDAELASDLAEALLRKHSEIPDRIEIVTDDEGLFPGQVQTIDLPAEDIPNDSYLIVEMSLVDLGESNLRTTYLASGTRETSSGFASWFKQLHDLGRQFAIGDELLVSDVRGVIDGLQFADTLTGTSSDVLGDRNNDPYSFAQVGSPVGIRYQETDKHYGPFCGVYEDFP